MKVPLFIASLAFVAGGAVSCFFGYRLFRLVLALFGFIGGALLAHALSGAGSALSERVAAALDPLPLAGGLLHFLFLLVVVVAGGLAGAAVLAWAYYLGVSLVGAVLGALVAHAAFAGDTGPTALTVVLCTVAGAIMAVFLERFVLILATAFGGAWAVLLGWLALRGDTAAVAAVTDGRLWLILPVDPGPDRGWVPLVWIVLGFAGAAAQLVWTAGRRRRVGPRRRIRGE